MRKLLLSILIFSAACSQKEVESIETAPNSTPTTEANNLSETVQLMDGFKVKFLNKEVLNDSISLFNSVEIMKGESIVWEMHDSLQFEKTNVSFPKLLSLNPEEKVVFLEVCDRPKQNKVLILKLNGTKMLTWQVGPLFVGQPKNLDNDPQVEWAGMQEEPEIWEEKKQIRFPYDPMLYFQVDASGVRIDSTLTVERNKAIYGDFFGYQYSTKRSFPETVGQKMSDEWDRLVSN